MSTANSTRAVSEADVQGWRACVGREIVQHAAADAEVLRRFALACGINADVEAMTPALAHWALFFDAVADERIGPDGHPMRGAFLPDVFLPRRMFAAAEMAFHAPLQLGEPTTMASTIKSVTHKSGRSGDLVFVVVRREVSQANALCVSEEQTIVYRPAGEPVDPVVPAELPAELPGENCEQWTPGPVQLFRFSAVTFNSHRIHYDLPYATGEEGYPGLVVHGPFTAVKLLDFACRKHAGQPSGAQPKTFSFRGLAPVFASQQVLLSGAGDPGEFVATRCDGTVAMSAEVHFS